MRTSLGQMNGDEWQSYCDKLLRIRYTDYQKIPSRFGGDFGIEGFTPAGLIFQCYCPDDDPCGNDLYEKQRDKITADINKLIKNAQQIAQLGANTIREWHFLTPDYDSRYLLKHARLKEQEVKRKALPDIDRKFKVCLKIEDDYIPERQLIPGLGGTRIQTSVEEPPLDKLDQFLSSDNDIVLNIKTKLEKLALNNNQQSILTRDVVKGYVVGQNELQTLNSKFPATYEAVVSLKSATESQLAIRALASSTEHGAVLSAILKEYEDELRTAFSSSLSSALIKRLSTEAISDWLGRCPLDFPEAGSSDDKH